MHPMDDIHANATSAATTQESAADVPPLPTLAPQEFHVLPPAKRPKINKNELRSENATINRMIKEIEKKDK